MRFFSVGPFELVIILVLSGILCFPTISLVIVALAKLMGIRLRGGVRKDEK